MRKTTILLIDDHTLVRETWSFIFDSNPAFSVVGEAGSAEDGIVLAASLKPDVVIMDINLPTMNGIDATSHVREVSPETKVLGVSLHTQPTYAKKMMQAGASGYVTKNSSREEMFEAVHQVIEGKKYVCNEIKNILSDQMINNTQTGGIIELSQREREIISFIRQGQSSKEMAAAMSISVKTVEVHRYNILKKLKLKNSAALVNFINTREMDLAPVC